MEPKDTFISTSNLFRLPQNQIFIAENVTKIGKTNCQSIRLLIIATSGIYLLRKGFSKYRIVKTITYLDLMSIHVVGMKCSFSSKVDQIRIKSTRVTTFAQIANQIRTVLFPSSIVPFSYHCPDDIVSIPFKYKSDNLLADRLMCAISISGIEQFNPSIFEIDSLIQQVTIDDDMLSSLIFTPLVTAFAFHESITEAELYKIPLSSFLENGRAFIKFGHYIKTLVFTEVTFDNVSNKFSQVLQKEHFLIPTSIEFNKITIDSNFCDFFSQLSLFNSHFESLKFSNCKFDSESLSAIFQTVLFEDCFHSLTSISIDNLSEIFDLQLQMVSLTCSSSVMLSHCLSTISLANCKVDTGFLLPQLLKFDFGLSNLCLAGSFLHGEMPSLSGSLDMLDLSNSDIDLDSLVSLLHAVSSTKIRGLNLSGIDSVPQAISQLCDLQMPNITTLIFGKSQFNSEATLSLTEFLEKQERICCLRLDECISIKDSATGLKKLCTFLSNKPLKVLSIKGNGTFEQMLGYLLSTGIKGSLSHGTLEELDVSNQNLPIDTLDMIIQTPSIKSLVIEGNSMKNSDLETICRGIIDNTWLEYAAFPSSDFERLKFDPSEFKRLWRIRFNQNTPSHISLTYSVDKLTEEVQKPMVPSPSQEVLMSPIMKTLTQRSPEIEALFKECVGNMAQEPLILLVNEIEALLDE